jgi:hypothetical protein
VDGLVPKEEEIITSVSSLQSLPIQSVEGVVKNISAPSFSIRHGVCYIVHLVKNAANFFILLISS